MAQVSSMNSYAKISGRLPDFKVRYWLLLEGGRQYYQRMRCDWAYEGDDIAETGIYMIWPEFLALDGSVVPQDTPIPVSGMATMWIMSPEMRRQVHCSRIQLGVKGYFMEGGRRVAEAIVTEMIGLHSNADLLG